MHRVLLLIRSSIVTCAYGKVNQTKHMNATFLTAVVYYVIGTKYWDFSGLCGLRIIIVPPDFLQLAVLSSLEADFLQQSYSKHLHLMHCVNCGSFEPFSDS